MTCTQLCNPYNETPSQPDSAWVEEHTQAYNGMSQKLKAALDDALCTFARQPGNVAPLLDRLLRSVVVQPRSLQEASSLTRADITYQLNEIEVVRAAGGVSHVCQPPLLPENCHARWKQ